MHKPIKLLYAILILIVAGGILTAVIVRQKNHIAVVPVKELTTTSRQYYSCDSRDEPTTNSFFKLDDPAIKTTPINLNEKDKGLLIECLEPSTDWITDVYLANTEGQWIKTLASNVDASIRYAHDVKIKDIDNDGIDDISFISNQWGGTCSWYNDIGYVYDPKINTLFTKSIYADVAGSCNGYEKAKIEYSDDIKKINPLILKVLNNLVSPRI